MKRAILTIFILALCVAPVLSMNIEPTATMTWWPTPQVNESSISEAIVENSDLNIIIKPIDSNGDMQNQVDITAIDETTTAVVEIENTDVEKIIEIAPESKLVVSENGESVKQGSGSSVELYYGYQKSYSQPWTDYARVDSCVDGICKVVLANFVEKRVWIEYKSENEILGIAASDTIPEFEGVAQ